MTEEEKSRVVIADYRTAAGAVDSLREMGMIVIKTCRAAVLYEAVCGHADMQAHCFEGGRLLCAPECYDHYRAVLTDVEIIKGSVSLGGSYPFDIAYNAAGVGENLICNAAYTAPELLSEYKNIISVRQGYSKCSICIVSPEAVITADSSIASAAEADGIDVLKIREGYIRLRDFPYGFIGGATGLMPGGWLAVNGDISTHPDCDNIISFCANHGVKIVSLKKGAIEDVGSFLTLNCRGS